MSSFFYSSKSSAKRAYPLPDTLDEKATLAILHDHSVLSQIFWPHSAATVGAENHTTVAGESKFVVEQEGLKFKATLRTLASGAITCTEELPVGSEITITYSVVRCDELPDREEISSDKRDGDEATSSGLQEEMKLWRDDQLVLLEQRSMTTFKVFSPFVKVKNGGMVLKTRNLLRVLESLGGEGKDLMDALAELNGGRTIAGEDSGLGKAKNE